MVGNGQYQIDRLIQVIVVKGKQYNVVSGRESRILTGFDKGKNLVNINGIGLVHRDTSLCIFFHQYTVI